MHVHIPYFYIYCYVQLKPSFERIVHWNMNNLLSFTHTYVVPNLYNITVFRIDFSLYQQLIF